MDNNQARVQQMLRSRPAGGAQGRAALKKPAAVVPQRDNAAAGNWRSGLVYAYPPEAGLLGRRGGVGIVLHYRRGTGGYQSLKANDMRLTPLKTQGVQKVFLKFLKQKALPLDLVKHIFSLPVENLQPAHVERWMAMTAIRGAPGASVKDVQDYLVEIREKLLSRPGVADIAFKIFRSIADLRASMSGFLNLQGMYAQVSPDEHFAAVLSDLMKSYLDLEKRFWVRKTLVNLKDELVFKDPAARLLGRRAQAWKYTFKKDVDCGSNGDVIAAFGAALPYDSKGEFARLEKYSQGVGEVLAQLVRYFGAKYDGAKSNNNNVASGARRRLDLAVDLKKLISRTRLLEHPMYRICGGFEALQADTGVLPALRRLMVQSESEVSSRAASAAVATRYNDGKTKNTCVAWPVDPKKVNGNGNGKNGATINKPPPGGGNGGSPPPSTVNQGSSRQINGGDHRYKIDYPECGDGKCFFYVVMRAIGYKGNLNITSVKDHFQHLNKNTNELKNRLVKDKLTRKSGDDPFTN